MDVENKKYLVCITEENGDVYWELLDGRTEAYEFIKSCIGAINFDKSFILTEGVKLEQRKSIYVFLKYVENLYEDNFSVDDYYDIEQDSANTENQLDNSIIVDNNDRINIQDIMM